MNETLNFIRTHSQNITLLYVEDDALSQAAMRANLQSFFPTILVASTGLEGVELFNRNRVDIVITDLTLPEYSGVELIAYIRETNKEIPIIVTTAHSETNRILETVTLGIDGYMIKPLDFKYLLTLLVKAIKLVANQQQTPPPSNTMHQNRAQALVAMVAKPLASIKAQMRALVSQTPVNDAYLTQTHDLVIKEVHRINEHVQAYNAYYNPTQEVTIFSMGALLDGVAERFRETLRRHKIASGVRIEGVDRYEGTKADIRMCIDEVMDASMTLLNAKNVEAKKIIITMRTFLAHIDIEFWDNGGGLDGQALQALFTPETGALAKAVEIAQRFHATIRAFNEEPGLKIRVTLPYTAPQTT